VTVDVAIVGGGISGLTAARKLCAHGLNVRLLEREPSCGGVIRTDRVDDFVIDSGPDTLLAHKPAALLLVRELGLEDHLVSPLPVRTTFVVRRSALRSLPETSALGLPTGWRTVAGSRAFSWHGKLRMAAEPFIRAAPPVSDESIGSFVRRRFGREAEVYVAEPVLAGLHRGDASRLSMRALFPFLADAERRHGSVARAWRQAPVRPGAGGSMSLRDGLSRIPERMQHDLPGGVTATRAEVTALKNSGTWRLSLGDGTEVRAKAVLLATPAYVTSNLVRDIDPDLSQDCGAIRYAPGLTVALGYRRDRVAHPLDGWGFVVPAHERRRVRSASWVSSKWPGRARPDRVLLRLSLNGTGRELDAPDETLIEWAHADMKDILGVGESPVMARVYRRPRAMPQLEVGHLDRMAGIDRRLAAHPGLFVSAAGFRGVGLPDCISDASSTADRVLAFVALSSRVDAS
jgi:oxygen-dependent protoporphyrinogen oxidase